ncbi:hypothetical protein F5883DRAFT_436874, partial [Diaporthe sp. PMI_573]
LLINNRGIHGKSSLLILENIIEHIRKSQGLNQVPRLYNYFDLIGDTSTRGIIAIMLKRLQITVDKYIQVYDKVSQAAFTPKRQIFPLPAKPKGTFSATTFKKAIKQIVQENYTNPKYTTKQSKDPQSNTTYTHNDLLFRDKTYTKTYVLSREYLIVETSANQVARVTSAATTFFKSIQLGRNKIEFIDTGFKYNNPTEILIKKAEKQFPKYNQLYILNIDTRLGSIIII